MSKTTTFSRVFHPKKIDHFLGKSKLNFWTKNEDFEQCGTARAGAWIPIFAAPWQILVANLLPREEGESPLLALKSRLSALQPSYPCLAANNPAVVVTAFAKAMSAPFHSRIAENASPTHSPRLLPFHSLRCCLSFGPLVQITFRLSAQRNTIFQIFEFSRQK